MDRRTFFKGAMTLPIILTPTKSMDNVSDDSTSDYSEENHETDENYEIEISDPNFRGKFLGIVEKTGRIRLPPRIFATLQNSGSRSLVMFSNKGYISCHPKKEWAKVEKNLLSRDDNDQIKRLICSRSHHCKVDEMGYVKIPRNFIAEQKIKDKVVFLGELDCFDIVDAELFKKGNLEFAKMLGNDEDIMNGLAELGLL